MSSDVLSPAPPDSDRGEDARVRSPEADLPLEIRGPDSPAFDRVEELYDQGQYLKAHQLAKTLEAFEDWPGARGLVVAGRLARVLGADNRSQRLFRLAWNRFQDDPLARYSWTRTVFYSRGPLFALSLLQRFGPVQENTSAKVASDWLSLHAAVLSTLRDFQRAQRFLEQAEEITPTNPWLWVERATFLSQQDQHEQALEAAYRALEFQPDHRGASQSVASSLVQLGQDKEALFFLNEACDRLESGWLELQRFELLRELGRFPEAWHSLEQYRLHSPLLEESRSKWLDGQLSDVAYHLGKHEVALELGKSSGIAFFDLVARNVHDQLDEQGALSASKRRQLPVGFIRQHHLTCAPATLSSLSQYWSRPVDQATIAEEICYDGTPAYTERRWAEDHDWKVVEFTVTWDNTRSLIDRGIPFILNTVDPGNGHQQAVIGYDDARKTILIRDPSLRSINEAIADKFFERYRSSGPGGMALVPKEHEDLLHGLELENAADYDLSFEVMKALENHDREHAQELADSYFARLDVAELSGNRLATDIEIALARYDNDLVRMLEAVDRHLQSFPTDVNFILTKVSLLRSLGRREERLDLLQQASRGEDPHPLLWQRLAEELSDDAAERKTALRLLRRAIRFQSTDSRSHYVLANLLWQNRDFETAHELYRIAHCLRDTDEEAANAFFSSSLHLRAGNNALLMLRDRFRRFASKSSAPGTTLFNALIRKGRDSEAFAVLAESLELRPHDGSLSLFAARAFAQYGKFRRAEILLERSRANCGEVEWRRAAGTVARLRGDLEDARRHWQVVVESQPLAHDANAEVARLLAETEGFDAAIDFLAHQAQRFPYSLTLNRLHIEWLRDAPETAEAALRELLSHSPSDAWAHRELASILADQMRLDESLASLAAAHSLEPDTPSYFWVLAKAKEQLGQREEAIEAHRSALALSVDFTPSIEALVRLARNREERISALDFVRHQLTSQVLFGDGLLLWREYARQTLSPSDVLDLLNQTRQDRPELWHAWSAQSQQLLEMGQLDEAIEISSEATERHPLLPRLWLDLANVHGTRLEFDSQIAALEKAVEMAPGWSYAARVLADACRRQGDSAKTRTVLERALAADPLDAETRSFLAEVLWQEDEHDLALEHLQQAITHEPGYRWAWNALAEWSAEAGKPELAESCAKRQVEIRPGRSDSWLALAATLTGPGTENERMQALDKALQLNPRLVEAHGRRAQLLAEVGRFDDARLACQPKIFGEHVPTQLKAIAADIEAQRGNLEEAVAMTRSVVCEEPDYYLGWVRLAEFASERDDLEDYLEAATAMVRIEPHDPMALGFLGDAQQRLGDKAAARVCFVRAMRLDPDYSFSAARVFDLSMLEPRDLELASEALEVLARAGSVPYLIRQLSFFLETDREAEAQKLLSEIIRNPQSPPGTVQTLIGATQDDAWNDFVDRELEEALAADEANPETAYLWARRAASSVVQPWLANHRQHSRWEMVAESYVAQLSEHDNARGLIDLATSHRDLVRASGFVWGQLAEALLAVGATAPLLELTSDWHNRRDLEPWMLMNIVVANLAQGNRAEARHLCLHAIDLATDPDADVPADDDTHNLHHLVASLLASLEGEYHEALSHLSQVNGDGFNDWGRALHAIAQTASTVWQLAAERKAPPTLTARSLDPTLRALFRLSKDYDLSQLQTQLLADLTRSLASLGPMHLRAKVKLRAMKL